ncbi:MAG TPA: hypothetical protein VIO32_02220, partial [Candidatus Baltobacteraceae bacterium]
MSQRVAILPIDRAEDVFALRQSGRAAAAAIGCEESEQVRVATALSELGRETLLHDGGASVKFFFEKTGALLVEIERFPAGCLQSDSNVGGFGAAQKLIGPMEVTASDNFATLRFRVRRGPLRAPAHV